MMIDVDGKNERKLGLLQSPVFTAGGKHIVALSPDYQREIWRLDRDGSNKVVLNAPKGHYYDFRRCCDGFLQSHVSGDRVGDIYVIHDDDWTVEKVASMR